MSKGRPPLEPRIRELEKQVNTLLNILHGMDDRIKELEGQRPAYRPVFDRWVGNGR
jgi:hypothetical protein